MAYGVRQKDGSYLGEMPPPLYVRRDIPPEEAEIEATRRTVALLEDVVRRYPEQWFWMHRRWKTRPPADGVAWRGTDPDQAAARGR